MGAHSSAPAMNEYLIPLGQLFRIPYNLQQAWPHQTKAFLDGLPLSQHFVGSPYPNALLIIEQRNVDCPPDMAGFKFTLRANIHYGMVLTETKKIVNGEGHEVNSKSQVRKNSVLKVKVSGFKFSLDQT